MKKDWKDLLQEDIEEIKEVVKEEMKQEINNCLREHNLRLLELEKKFPIVEKSESKEGNK